MFQTSAEHYVVTAISGVTRGRKGETMPRAPSHWGYRKVPTMLPLLSSIQYIYSRKTLGSNMGVPNLFLALGAMQLRYDPDCNDP